MKMVNWMWKGKEKPKEQPEKKEEEEVDEAELQKKGFNPEGLEIEEAKEELIAEFDKDYEQFISPTPEELAEIVANLKFFPAEDEPRHALAYSGGGKICGDKKVVNKIRSIGKEMIKLIGKKIISGDMNLTRVSFPIKAMVPKTALENSTVSGCMLPYFMGKASSTKDPVERMKYVLTSITSSAYYMNMFLKPLNPVIGETLQGSYPDGTKIYCEQISHHPPISFYLFVGPNDSYRYSGYYAFEANAGLNSMTLANKGQRTFAFADGGKIEANFSKQIYGGVFIGSLRSQATGSFILKDQDNKVECEIKYGKMKKKPSDYFEGSIIRDGKKASSFIGTYCGFLDFDGVRYWDGRYLQAVKISLEEKPLQSDFRNRQDLIALKEGNLAKAQVEKENLQNFQRADVKLRAQYKKQNQ